ncbi:MAG: YifB family Mg chelatase-like AAA ATPase, partial [Lentisphaeraceae bacterium]|nr:YifB family Mg chelatase-like AAA ATPase [Lentisphaeraceae bacterium]
SHVKGQHAVKRGLEIAAAGAHNILMIGPPGCGKSLLARSYASILPKLNLDEALKVTQIHSIAGSLPEDQPLVTNRPFRSPHHTISDAGLLGGTSNPRPGEVSLAHKGVLFLDELPEYKRATLEVMRQPLESGEVTISRASGTATFPADFMLLAAMNPCPCGHYGSVQRQCRCSSSQITRYRSKISGPLLDRIDIHLEVTPVSEKELMNKSDGEKSADIRQRVDAARAIQKARFNSGVITNSSMKPQDIQEYCEVDPSGRALLKTAINDLNLSARAYDRILRLARTIADLESSENLQVQHIAEAVQYRTLDRKLW